MNNTMRLGLSALNEKDSLRIETSGTCFVYLEIILAVTVYLTRLVGYSRIN